MHHYMFNQSCNSETDVNKKCIIDLNNYIWKSSPKPTQKADFIALPCLRAQLVLNPALAEMCAAHEYNLTLPPLCLFEP